MKTYKVVITSYAKGQMQEIKDYIKDELVNPDAARNLLTEMREHIKKLAYVADSIKRIEEEPWGSHGVRKTIVKNFYVYFWIDVENIVVYIIAVTYAKRNQKKVLERIKDMEYC